MSYKLKFLPSALKEWHKLAPELKEQFKAHLSRRLENPYIVNDRPNGATHVRRNGATLKWQNWGLGRHLI